MPLLLSSLLHRTRAALLALLIVVLPLQGVVQLVAAVQGPRHLHADLPHAAPSASPLRQLLDRLHAAQPQQLKTPGLTWALGAQTHAHGGIVHSHGRDMADVVTLADAGDDAGQGGATAFLAWLPAALSLPAAQAGTVPVAGTSAWRDRVMAPPLTPPRG